MPIASAGKQVLRQRTGIAASDLAATGASLKPSPPITGPNGFDHFASGEAVPVLSGRLGGGSDPWGLDGFLAGEVVPALAQSPTESRLYLPTGSAVTRVAVSSWDAAISAETGRAVSSGVVRGASERGPRLRIGTARSRLTARGSDAVLYNRAGSGTSNMTTEGIWGVVFSEGAQVDQVATEVLIMRWVEVSVDQIAVEVLRPTTWPKFVSFDRVRFAR
jgi:hypothetical protein